MYYYNEQLWGMHMFWWVFWILMWVSFFSFLTPVPRRRWKNMQESPQQVLLSRLARGEINEKEYESRKAVIDRDLGMTLA